MRVGDHEYIDPALRATKESLVAWRRIAWGYDILVCLSPTANRQ